MLDKLKKISIEVDFDYVIQTSHFSRIVWEYLASNKALEDLTFDDFEFPSNLPISELLSLRWTSLKRFALIRFDDGGNAADPDGLLGFVRAHQQLQTLRIDNWTSSPVSNSQPQPVVHLPHLTSLHIHPNLIPVFHPSDAITSLTISRAHNLDRTSDHDVILASCRYSRIKSFGICTNGCQTGETQVEHYSAIFEIIHHQFKELEELRIRFHPWHENVFQLVSLNVKRL